MRDIARNMRRCAEDPMWADHAEVPKAWCEAAAAEIERLRTENAELRACFATTTFGMPFEQVSKIISDAKAYVATLADRMKAECPECHNAPFQSDGQIVHNIKCSKHTA